MRPRILTAVAVTAVCLPLTLVVGMGVAHAGEREGCTRMQLNTGLICARVDATSPQSLNSFGGAFVSGTIVVRPRLVAELLNDDGSVASTVEQSWGTDRITESIKKEINMSEAARYSRVCATLYEAGEKLNTAGAPVPSRP